ncbi:uncharacterized protein LOC113334243 [Papaver somniferum]|uniref:uncharacterized protein LOC113334243 n=1 Tax=Papaver somniferum TaxID=3469 RepID=UPI000E703715|nr:uncharacterized protein LOC113334243 [Papaver somniferum]
MLRHFNTASVNRSANRNDVLAQATKIADLLKHTDVSYVNLREGVSSLSRSSTEPSSHYHQVLKYDSEAFECSIPVPGRMSMTPCCIVEHAFALKKVCKVG